MTAKLGLWRYYQGHRYLLAPTPLNLRTSARYDACNGAHKVCRKCRVPFGGPKIVPSRARWNGVGE